MAAKYMIIKKNIIVFNYDIEGQDRNAKLTKIFAKDSHGAFVMCDATNPETRNE